MPIRRERYPADWKKISLAIRDRSNGYCEKCGARNGCPHPVTGSQVVLTVAHLDDNTSNNDPENLKALCQRCHLAMDRWKHIANSRRTRAAKLARFQRDMFEQDGGYE